VSWLERRSTRTATRGPGSGFAESTLAQAAWERTRKAVARWGWAGLVCGAVVALVAFAPAAWLAEAVATQTRQRLLLTDARGTIWSGSAVPVLTGGPGSRGMALELRVRQSCCIDDQLLLRWRPSLGKQVVQLMPGSGHVGEWPAAWLAGLGAPWNSMQLGGTLRLSSPGAGMEVAAGRLRFTGQASLELIDVSSSLSMLDRLGSYRVQFDAAADGAGPAIALSTLDGALRLDGKGQWTGTQLRFRGEARAAPGFEGALDNLLNIFGRRQGALSLISIG
jgi:general secretion pathway protein N